MSNSRIEQIIEEIEDYIDSCKGPLFGGGDKIVVDRERMEELLRELRMKTPEEIKRYQKILANKDAILADAQQKAEVLLHRQIFRIRSWSMSMRSCSRHMSRLIR